MELKDIELIISKLFKRRTEPIDVASEEDWASLEKLLRCEFSNDYRSMVHLIGQYWFEGDFLIPRRRLDIDGIFETYEAEIETGRNWDLDLIPIMGIGNGDYVCFRASECPESPIYYVYHEDDSIERLHSNIVDFISDPDWFGD